MQNKRENNCLNIKDIQSVSLDILKQVADICESNGFRYCLAYGTLLGAIRHDGYIPWDDDVDIIMPRPDYEAFLQYATDHKDVMKHLEVFNKRTCKNYPYCITRVSDSRYIIHTDNERDCGMGIFIDIYPYDGIGNDEGQALKELELCSKNRRYIIEQTRLHVPIPKELNWKGKISFKLNYWFHKFLGVNYYYNISRRVIRKYTWTDSKYVGCLAWAYTPKEDALYHRFLYEDLIKHPFDKYEFFIPRDYHTVLTKLYGDYMQLPPVEKRVYHHGYRAYKK